MKARFVLLLCGVAVAETGVQIFPKLETRLLMWRSTVGCEEVDSCAMLFRQGC